MQVLRKNSTLAGVGLFRCSIILGLLVGPAFFEDVRDLALGATELAGPAVATQTGNPLWAVPLRSLPMTQQRPLFTPSRRPPAATVVMAPPLAPPAPPKATGPDHPLLSLVGTIIGETQSIGIFFDQAEKSFIRLKTGQDHAGWTLRAIQQREAIFEKGTREATLVLPARSAQSPGGAIPPGSSSVDGSGQRVSPTSSPKPPWLSGAANVQAQPAAVRLDGDERVIAPPPAQASTSAH